MASSSSTLKPRAERFTAEEVAAALRASKGLVTVAARNLQCDPDTIRNYTKRYASVKQALVEAREGILDLTEARLFQAIDKGEPWAIAMALRTIGKDRGYIEKHQVENSGDVTVRVVYGSDDSIT